MVIMELVNFAKELLQSAAEHAASYKLGQTVLRHVDRTLWVIEKSARWAVPPSLDQDERPPPELVRPLPWIFFLPMLIALRFTRESISLLNLVMGKPPLRSADVVTYVQSKRRYLRTLKYQGNRMMRARSSNNPQSKSWCAQIRALASFTMCLSNNGATYDRADDVMLINCSHRNEREDVGEATADAGRSMEKLIEKMMTDLRAESDDDDDDSFTLTNVNSTKSSSESEQDTAYNTDVSTTNSGGVATSTPQRPPGDSSKDSSKDSSLPTDEENINNNTLTEKSDTTENDTTHKTSPAFDLNLSNERSPDKNGDTTAAISPKELSQKFIQNEANNKSQTQKKSKIANGRARKTSATRNREYARQ